MDDNFTELVGLVEQNEDKLPSWIELFVDLVAQVSNGGIDQFAHNIGLGNVDSPLANAAIDVPELSTLRNLFKAARAEYLSQGRDEMSDEEAAELEEGKDIEALETYIYEIPGSLIDKVLAFAKSVLGVEVKASTEYLKSKSQSQTTTVGALDMKKLDKFAGQLRDFMEDEWGTITRKGGVWTSSDGGAEFKVSNLTEEEAKELDKMARKLLPKDSRHAMAAKAKKNSKAAAKKPAPKASAKKKATAAGYSWEPEIIKEPGYEVDTNEGTFFFPKSVAGPVDVGDEDSWKKEFELFLPGSISIESVDAIDGYFGRYQAPGYTDSSDWHFNKDKDKLKEELDSMYGPQDAEASAEDSLEDCTEFVLKCKDYYLAKEDLAGKSWTKNLELAYLFCSEAEAKEALASADLPEEKMECVMVAPLAEEVKDFAQVD